MIPITHPFRKAREKDGARGLFTPITTKSCHSQSNVAMSRKPVVVLFGRVPHPSFFEGWDSAPTARDLSLTAAI